jgi:hypothetical protein
VGSIPIAHFSLPGVSLRCPSTRPKLSPTSHSLDAATTVLSIGLVYRLLGRVHFRWSNPSVIDPPPPVISVSYAEGRLPSLNMGNTHAPVQRVTRHQG